MDTNTDFYSWIDEHKSDDPARLRLKYGRQREQEILQIESRRKYAAKLAATLAADPEFIFPTALSGEQSTSDQLAVFHAEYIACDMTVVDLTAGLGIDAMAFARAGAAEVVAIERDAAVADALRHNARNIPQLKVITADCRDQLQRWADEGRRFDYAFIDPARRLADGRRAFALDQCEPDVVEMLPLIAKVASMLIIKASPMLDITHTLSLLPQAVEVAVVGTTTECKELDLLCDLRTDSEPSPVKIIAVTLGSGVDSRFSFTRGEEARAKTIEGVPRLGDIIYDPYPAVMKAAPYKLLAERFGLKKAGANSHVWFGAAPVQDFPGRGYRIVEVLPYMSKHIKRYASRWPRVSVSARNFEITSDALRAKLGVKDGPMRLFATTVPTGRLMLTCEPL